MADSTQQVQMELMAPQELDAAIANKSVVYIPLGAIEYHGPHLPIGLDCLTSHGLCLQVAKKIGGVVMPPLYYGMTGSIGHHPWTICVEGEEEFLAILRTTLRRLQDFNIDLAVVFTGHFGRRQLAALQVLEKEWAEGNNGMKLLYLSIHNCPNASLKGDHGAIFETSVLTQLRPELVHLDRLPNQHDHPAADPQQDSWGPHRRDPENVLFGILGDDPRNYHEETAKNLVATLSQWMEDQISQATLSSS